EGKRRQLELAARNGAGAGAGLDRTGSLGDALAREGSRFLVLVRRVFVGEAFFVLLPLYILVIFGFVILLLGVGLIVLLDRHLGASTGTDQARLDPHHLGGLALCRGFGLGHLRAGARRLAAALAVKE